MLSIRQQKFDENVQSYNTHFHQANCPIMVLSGLSIVHFEQECWDLSSWRENMPQ